MIVAYNALSLRPDVLDGAATYSLNLLRHLPDALPEAQFVVYARAGEARVPVAPNVDVRHLPVRGVGGRVLLESVALNRELARARADVLLSPNESVPFRMRCRLVVVAQNVVYHCDRYGSVFGGRRPSDRIAARTQASFYRRRMRSAYRRADAVVACSRFAADLLAAQASLDRARTTVVLSGSDSFLLPRASELPSARRLLAVGSIAPHKRLEQTLALFAALRALDPELTLDLVGPDWRGFSATIRDDVQRLGLEASVRLLGSAHADELACLYASSEALLHLSTCESFGLPLVEAMRYGLPVVAASTGPSPEVAAGAALLVDPDQPEAAARAVCELLRAPERREELRRRGRDRAAFLSWARTAQGFADVLERVTRIDR